MYLIGSRVKGDFRADSDPDIAIILKEDYGYTSWFYESDEWQAELRRLVDIDVHLLRGGGSLPDDLLEAAIVDHGVLVFSRK